MTKSQEQREGGKEGAINYDHEYKQGICATNLIRCV